MKWLNIAAKYLLWAGGLNWGLVGLLKFNLVEYLFGAWPGLVMLLYVLIGLSTVYIVLNQKK